MIKWSRVKEIVRKEFLQVFRDPRMLFVLLVPPLAQTVIFGFAVNLDVTEATLAWLDRDRSQASRELYEAFNASGYFRVVAEPEDQGSVTALLDRGDVMAAVSVLPGFEEAIVRGRSAPVQILIDGSNSNSASVVMTYTQQTVAQYSQRLQSSRLNVLQLARTQGAGSPVLRSTPEIDLASRVWFNPNLLSRDYFIPGVIANILALVTLMLTAMGIVREKEIGTMEQIMVTPIRPLELMLGKTLPFAMVGLFDVAAMTGLVRVVFGTRLEGSLLLLLAAASLFLLATLGIGIFISTLSNTQQQAMMLTFFAFILLFLLSGFAFPINSMPESVQYLTLVNPVRYFMEIVRGLFLKGVGLGALWSQMAALAAIGSAILLVSAQRFRKRLD